MPDRLLAEFPEVTKAQWLDKLKADLKGKPYEKLVRVNESGIAIAPVYTAEDLPDGVTQSFTGRDDLRRGDKYLMGVDQGGWWVGQDLSPEALANFDQFAAGFVADNVDGRSALRIVLQDQFAHAFADQHAPKTGLGLSIDDWSAMDKVMAWANANGIKVVIEAGDAAFDFLESGHLGQFSGSLDLNPLDYLRHGRPDESLLEKILPRIAKAMQHLPAPREGRSFQLSTFKLQQLELAGANAAQQIAFALAMANDLGGRMTGQGISAAAVFQTIGFQFPIATDFFGEIAKLRAFRILWGRVLEAWGVEGHPSTYTFIQGVPAWSSETMLDPHVNLLRHTTQCMSAAMGGCDMVILPGFDATYEVPTADALRTARNIQLVLKKEAYLAHTVDAAGGAYFVEQLTDTLADKAWAIFQSIEAAGGWYLYLGTNLLEQALAQGLEKRSTAVRTGARSLLGTNHFPNELEKMHTMGFATGASEDSKLLKRLRLMRSELGLQRLHLAGRRLAADFEALRQRTAALRTQSADVGVACLLTLGDPTMRAARSNFARNVLAAGGYTCTENAHPSDLQKTLAFLQTLQPSTIVLCGADNDYLGFGVEWLQAIRKALPMAVIVLAGRPEGWQNLQAEGIWEPIYAGMDRVAFLDKLLDRHIARKGALA